ncbi:sugar ABC transporter substrate-binding protein [Lederbergia ruris]|uniref:Sugar ABC transporter substrate-binding protein n=1 Tax=Lederbergia ruris TaxID=217495 RepID=A0ABQ4KRH4_9BACI|nr:extracellular solute-binding protein [Lederbergia ruris]GIN59769.1 sugar ABC transporter substrate-binding protein [Lederbergia ruris]
MKFKKLIVLLAVSMIAILGLAACGGTGTSSKAQNVVEIQTDKSGESNNAKGALPIIKEKSGLDLKYVPTPDYSAYQTSIQQSLSTKKAPALFTWWTGSQMDNLVENDLLEDLTEEWENYYIKNGVNEEIAKSLTIDGKIYGAPLNIIYNGVFYNKEIFAKYNLEEPDTFDDFIKICDTLLDNGVTPIGIGNTWQSFVWPMALMGSMDADLYDEWTEGKAKFTDERVKAVFYKWSDMLAKGYFSEQQQDQVKDFATGEVAMIYNATNLLSGFAEDYGFVSGEDIDMFTLPSMDDGNKPTVFYEVAPILVGKNSKDKEQGIKILRSYYDQDVQQAYADVSGMASVSSVNLKDPISKQITEEANDTENFNLKLRYYEQFLPEIINLSIDEYWKIAADPSEKQVDSSLEAIQAEQDKLNP